MNTGVGVTTSPWAYVPENVMPTGACGAGDGAGAIAVAVITDMGVYTGKYPA